MPTTSQESAKRQRLAPEDRRRALIAATIQTLGEEGAKGTTLRQTCKRAGVAPGLISHFFGSWHDLLLTAYDSLTGAFTVDVTAIQQNNALGQSQKLDHLIRLFFSEDWTSNKNGDAYVALWALSRTEVDLQERMSRHHEELHSQITAILTGLTDTPAELADELILQLNGIWMDMILNPSRLSPEKAHSIAVAWTERLIPGAFETKA